MKRLQTQLILAFGLVILVVLCGISITLVYLLRENPQQDRVIYSELSIQARVIALFITRFPRANPLLGGGDARLLDVAETQDVRIGWASGDGEVIFDSEHQWDKPGAEELFASLNPVPDGRWMGRVREDRRVWVVLAYPLPGQDDTPMGQRYLILARSRPVVAFIQQFRRSIARPLLQAGLLAFVVGLVLAVVISRSIAKPLRQVSKAAISIAAGNLDARAPKSGPAEVRQMAEAFNRMAAEVQVSQKSQKDLVANIAHDLRTPLTSIQGFAQALIDGTAEAPDHYVQAARAIYEESRRINKMAADLLDLARFEAGQVEIKQEEVDLALLVETRIQRLQYLADSREINFQRSDRLSIFVVGDEIRLAQVLDNLLGNAVQYTDAGDRITVSLMPANKVVKLCIADTGVGIPAEDLPRIFERFYRGDKSRRGTGTGLGLAIVREIIEAHQAEIKVESVVDVGTRFLLTFPISD
jgi:signal transduction histidine kinase